MATTDDERNPEYVLGAVLAQIEDLDAGDRIRVLQDALAQCSASDPVSDRDALVLFRLQAARRADVANLIATYPGQVQNAATYEQEIAGARLGRMHRKVTTKGHHSVYQRGESVLVLRANGAIPGIPSSVSIWGINSGSPTVVNPSDVEIVAIKEVH